LLLVLVLAVGCGTAPPPQPGVPANAGGETGAAGGGPGETGATPFDPTDGWEKIREEDGITVYRKEVEGSPLVAFRGEGEIAAPIARVAAVQMDLDHTHEWVERLKEAKMLEARSESEFLTYSHIGAPPLVSDRDFVNQVKIDFAPPSRIKFNLQSVDDPKAPVTDYVHGKLIKSSFELTALAPDRTRLVCEIHADPKGSLPKWVVNQFQKGWAFKTITQMRKQVQKPDVVERVPLIRGILNRQGFPILSPGGRGLVLRVGSTRGFLGSGGEGSRSAGGTWGPRGWNERGLRALALCGRGAWGAP